MIETAGSQSLAPTPAWNETSLPPLEADLIDIQVDAAIRKKQVLFSVEELEGQSPVTVAIRTAPLMVDGRGVGATWVMTRLVDPLFVDRSLQGYRLAAGLALGGIALAFALTAGLARTVRRQAAERDRLQTELRRSERLAALGKLLAGVAHEVRNPLAGIRSTAQLWQRGVVGLDDESLGGLVHEVDRLEEIVSRLLQFSRADAQDLAPGDLNAVVAEAARLAGRPLQRGDSARGRPRPRSAAGRDGPAGPAAGLPQPDDQRRPGHAARAAPSGLTTRRDPARQAVRAERGRHRAGPRAPKSLGHLFEPFFTTKAEGTGLGLAIAREIALAHRGDLRAANRTGRARRRLHADPAAQLRRDSWRTPMSEANTDDPRGRRRLDDPPQPRPAAPVRGLPRHRGGRRRRGPGRRSSRDSPTPCSST